MNQSAEKKGTIVRINGPVVDVAFSEEYLPPLLQALYIPLMDRKITVEVEQQIGNYEVRCIAMESTDGLSRGMEVFDTGGAISVPVGPEVLDSVEGKETV